MIDENLLEGNKYFKWYWSICNRAKDRVLSPDIYVEKHHIYPKSIYGKNKDLVKLTAKEHYIVHLLLWWGLKCKLGGKDKNTRKMCCAFTMMNNFSPDHKDRYNSKIYSFLRIAYSEANKDRPKHERGMYNKKHTDETIRKISISQIGKNIPAKQRLDISNTLKEYYKTHDTFNKGIKYLEFFGEERASEISKNMKNGAINRKKPKIKYVMKYLLLNSITNEQFYFVGDHNMFNVFLHNYGESYTTFKRNKSKIFKLIEKYLVKVDNEYNELS